jgi:hypothetical protein
VLENQHRIGVVDRREEQSLGVVRRRWLHDLQPRHVREPRFQALAVLRGGAGAGTAGQADHHRHAGLAAEHEMDLGRLIDDLLHCQRHEVGELQLEHRLHAGNGRADGRTRNAELADRRVDDALRAETMDEVARHTECAAVDADVLAEQENPLVRLHRLGKPFADRLGVRQFARPDFGRGDVIRHRHPA